MVKIYFNQGVLIITNPDVNNNALVSNQETVISKPSADEVFAIINDMEINPKKAIIQTKKGNEILEVIKQRFVVIQAGGGFIYTPDNYVLMIYRKGKWDLPKGKLDDGENLEECAVREVEEETGIQNITLGKKLTITYHTYEERNKKILKESHWYLMKAAETQLLTPQTEEDIEQCKWVALQDIHLYLTGAHSSIVDVLNRGMEVLNKRDK